MRTIQTLTVVGLLGITALVGCGKKPVDTSAELKTTRLAELAKPATVLIVSDYTASIEVPNVTIPADRQQLLQQRLAEKVQAGTVPSDQASILRAAVMELLDHWQDYLAPAGTSRTVNANLSAVGSGFFVTPDGYLVTNAHVVTEEGDELKKGLAENGLSQLVDEDVKTFSSELGGQVDQEMLQKLRSACVDFYVANMTISNINRKVSVELGAGMPGMETTQKGVAAEVVQMGTPIPGKDVAILKIQAENMPTLTIGDDKALQVGDKIFPLGFPADATFFPEFDVSSAGQSSLTAGLVSSRKQMKEGWEVIQTDAVIRGGNSGGPVLDSQGNVIGLATFSLIDRETGTSAEGAHFVVPISIVSEFLGRANVKPSLSSVSKLYREGLEESDAKHYKLAKEKFQQIEALKPGQPWMQKAKSDAEKNIMEGKDESPGLPIVPIAIGGGVLLLVIVGLAFVLGRKGGGGAQLPPPPAQIPPPSGPPPQLG